AGRESSHCARLAVPRTTARHSGAQADQRHVCIAASLVCQCDALEGRTDERCRCHDPPPFRGRRRLGENAPDQRIDRGGQWLVPGSQTQGAWLRALLHHAYRAVPDRRKARLLQHQPACLSTHLKFKRAEERSRGRMWTASYRTLTRKTSLPSWTIRITSCLRARFCRKKNSGSSPSIFRNSLGKKTRRAWNVLQRVDFGLSAMCISKPERETPAAFPIRWRAGRG